MSRTYTLSPTGVYGGRTTNRNLYMSTMQPWADGKRVGCWKQGSTEYYGAVSFFFNFGPVIGKTIQSIVLTPACSSTFAWSEEVIYYEKSTDSVTDWTIAAYADEVTVEKYGVIPPLDVTAFGIPFSDAYVIGGYYRTYAYADITGATLTVVTAETTKTVTYNNNGGSGAPGPTELWGETAWDGYLSMAEPTRIGYRFEGWNTQSNGSGTFYEAGSYISIVNDTTLYAVWTALFSEISSAPNTNIGSAITVSWVNYGNFTNKIRFVFGAVDSGEINVSGTSYSYTLPTTWYAQVPNATSGNATVYLYTYVNNTLLGVDSKTFVASVPASIVPSIGSVVAEKINENQTVANWNIYLQNYSKVKLTASGCYAGQGASISSYQFLGQNLNKTNQVSNASSNATSEIIEVSGALQYSVKVTDSRGRTATINVTISVDAYSLPAIESINAVRSNSDGTENAVTGTSIKATSTFSYTVVGSNALTRVLSYKKHYDSTYTQAQTNIVSGTSYVIAAWLADIASSYDVKVEISDSLNNSASFVVIVPPVAGIAFGLKNDRARFGGPVEKAGFQVDWNAEFNGVVDVTNRRCYAKLSNAGWYRVLRYSGETATQSNGSTGARILFNIVRYGNQSNSESHSITMESVTGGDIIFTGESSHSGVLLIDKIRYSKSGNDFFVDIHYSGSYDHDVDVFFVPYIYYEYMAQIESLGLIEVNASPAGETIVNTYSFSKEAELTCLKYFDDDVATSYTIGSSGYKAVSYPSAIQGKRIVSIVFLDWGTATGAITPSPIGDTAGNGWYLCGNPGAVITNVKFRYWYVN